MSLNGSKKFLSHIALFFFLLTALGSGHGTVLCFGVDGHVALEASAAGDCHIYPTQGAGKAAIPRDDPSVRHGEQHLPYGSCLDIPLFSGYQAVVSLSERSRAQKVSPHSYPPSSAVSPTNEEYSPRKNLFPHIHACGEAYAALASTVLRI